MRSMAASSASAHASLPRRISRSVTARVRATRYTFITPYLAGSIWYDAEDLWVHGEFERDGAKIQYRLES